MSLGWKEWSKSDIIYGIIIPLIVVLMIVGLSLVRPFLMASGGMSGNYGVIIGIVFSIQELAITVAVPLVLGLIWNRWAGGASGFLLGSIFSIWYAVSNGLYGSIFRGMGGVNLGPSLLGWVLSAMLIGYMAGSLNRNSDNFRRMLIVGVVATLVGGVFLFGMFQLSPSNVVTGEVGFALTVLPRIAVGAIIPIIAKVFMWYGFVPHKR
jgi:hypothetical protein